MSCCPLLLWRSVGQRRPRHAGWAAHGSAGHGSRVPCRGIFVDTGRSLIHDGRRRWCGQRHHCGAGTRREILDEFRLKERPRLRRDDERLKPGRARGEESVRLGGSSMSLGQARGGCGRGRRRDDQPWRPVRATGNAHRRGQSGDGHRRLPQPLGSGGHPYGSRRAGFSGREAKSNQSLQQTGAAPSQVPRRGCG